MTGENGTVMDAIVLATKAEFQHPPFVWQANKSVADPFEGNAERLPNLPHGLNDYSHVNNIAFLSSLNPSPNHFCFLKTRGVKGEDVRRAIYCATAYQAVMRTSIRDPKNTDPKTIVVPDKGAAHYLQSLFPGSRIEKLETAIPDVEEIRKVGRPRVYESANDRVRACRKRKKDRNLKELTASEIPYHDRSLEKKGQSCNETGIESSYTHFVSLPLTISIYRAKFSPVPRGYRNYGDIDAFIDHLRTYHSRTLPDKHSNLLISPAIFDPNHPNRVIGQKQGLKNIVYLRHIWLDFENGDLKPDEIAVSAQSAGRIQHLQSYARTTPVSGRVRPMAP